MLGMFRLCKVNSDNERAIAQTLDIQSLPTVFAINKGQNYDRFQCIVYTVYYDVV